MITHTKLAYVELHDAMLSLLRNKYNHKLFTLLPV